MVAMGGDGWFLWNSSDQTTQLRAGLRTYTIYDYGTSSTYVQSGQLSGLGSAFPSWATVATNLYDGGTIILATGVITLVILVLSLVLVILHLIGKAAATKMYLGTIGFLVSVGLIVLASVLYSRKLNVGYSFLLFLVAGFISVFTWLIALSAFPSDNIKKPRIYFSLLLSSLILTFSIAGMATTFWFSQDWTQSGSTGSNNFGLLGYYLTFTTSGGQSVQTSGTFSQFYNQYPTLQSQVQPFQDGGRIVMGTGIVALLGTCVSIVFMVLSLIRPHPARFHTLVVSILSMLVASVLFLVGVSLYAFKLWVSWSLMLYLGCALLLLGAVLLILKGVHDESQQPTKPAVQAPTINSNPNPNPNPPPVPSGGAYDNSDFAAIVGADQASGAAGTSTRYRYN